MTTAVPSDELNEAERTGLDTAISDLASGAERWAKLGLAERAELLKRTHAAMASQIEPWARAAIAAKKIPPGPLEGEEWAAGPYATLNGFALVAQSLEKMAKGGNPTDGIKTTTAPGGRVAFKVMPSSLYDWLLLSGYRGEVWMPPGVSEAQARASAGLGARKLGESGGVGLVLGAGNISAIGPLDVLYELVAFNRASVLKLNPTFASLTDVYERALQPLISFGVLRVVNGGAATGAYLAHHDEVSHVHITGSAATHDAIVWGTGEEGDRRRAEGDPQLRKPISSELGGVSPVIVVPGEWSEADLRYQAEQIVTMRMHNTGHNCVAAQVVLLSADWPQREQFLRLIGEVFDQMPARDPWYPGTDRRVAAAESAYPNAVHHGPGGNRLLVEVAPEGAQELCTTEYFGPVLGHVALPGTGQRFLDAAVSFANDRLYGTLGANVIVSPETRKTLGSGFDNAVADLRYGTVAINVWTALAFLGAGLPWGAFPGHTLQDVGSGIGVVHNAHLIENTERAVVYGPFRPFPRSLRGGEWSMSPKAPWFVTNRSEDVTSRRLTEFAAAPSVKKLPGIFAAAFRG